jgi:murein L,D-transpeptidase YafK
MSRWLIALLGTAILGCLLMTTPPFAQADRAQTAAQTVLPALQRDAKTLGLRVGAPVFVRIFKQEAVLELWLKGSARYQLFRSYPICAFSGALGPKRKEGDGQAPEGIYAITPQQMNPFSNFHLSFNLGYPNAFDQANGRTGSALMVHGNCVSIGCYAMTDAKIEEIYTLMSQAFAGGQRTIAVHAFPFKLAPETLASYQEHPDFVFWRELQPIYQAFVTTALPPKVRVRGRHYELLK